MAIISVPGCQCDRCRYIWLPRGEALPRRCASCKSPAWNRDRKAHPRPLHAAGCHCALCLQPPN